MRGYLSSWLIGGLLSGAMASAFAEEITLTTYYPSPRGVYKELRTTNNTNLAMLAGGVGVGTSAVPQAILQVVQGDAAAGALPAFLVEDQASPDPSPFSITVAGDVGIGTAAPIHPLDIRRTGANDAYVGFQSDSGFLLIGADSGGGGTPGLAFPAAGSTFAFGTLPAYTGGAFTELMRLTSAGNLGIGTPDPQYQVELMSDTDVLAPPFSTTGVGFVAVNSARTMGAGIGFSNTAGTSGWGAAGLGDDYFGMTIDDSNPNPWLEIRGKQGILDIVNPDPVPNLHLYIGATTATPPPTPAVLTNGDILATVSNQFHVYSPALNPRLIVDAAGNVGIGTTGPAQALDIVGSDRTVGLDEFTGPWLGLLVRNTAGTGTAGFGLSTATGQSGFGGVVGGNRVGLFTTSGPDRANLVSSSELRVFTGWNPPPGPGVLAMVIDNTGNVGIGTLAPTERLHVIGKILASDKITEFSDVRLKTHVMPLSDALEKLEQIRGVTFEWNTLAESLGNRRGEKNLGVIAQEVGAVFPELVTASGGEGSYQAVDYGRFSAVLLEAVKELHATQEALTNRLEVLERRLGEAAAVESR